MIRRLLPLLLCLGVVTSRVQAAPIAGPTNVMVSPNPCGTGDATVQWDPSPVSGLDRYEVQVTHPGGSTETFTVPPTEVTYTFNPQPGGSQINVVAVDSVGGTSAPAATPTLITDETPPATPAQPAWIWNHPTSSAKLSWPATTDEGTSTAGYTVMIDQGGFQTFQDSDGSPFNFTPPEPATYSFSVSARDAAGNASSYGPALTVALPPAPPTQLRFVAAPASPAAVGQALSFELAATDGSGVTVTTYGGTVEFQVEGGNAALLPAPYTFVPGDSGQHAFDAQLRFDAPGSYRLVASDPADPSLVVQAQIEVPAAATAPVFTSQPNTRGVVGVAYRVTAEGSVTATGEGEIVYATCGAPAGMTIDASSGAVRWTPTSAGLFSVCLSATNGSGTAQQLFEVDVSATAVEVVARLSASPAPGTVQSPVTLDASTSTTSGDVLGYRWSFGDGAVALTDGANVQHTYWMPGSYRAQVTVLDAQGIASTAQVPVVVQDGAGRVPPTAVITASALTGEGYFEATLGCDCTQGSAPIVGYAWDLGGATATGAQITRGFSTGRYLLRLVVVDANGLTGSATAEVVVTGSSGQVPPACMPSASPATGLAPLSVEHQAHAEPGSAELAQITWELEGVPQAGRTVSHVYQNPGWYLARLKVEDANGLACHATLPVVSSASTTQVPPLILESWSEATVACGESYTHDPIVVGGGEVRTFALADAPEGMSVDPATGRVTWRPAPWQSAMDASNHTVLLSLTSGSEVAHQYLYVVVGACSAVELNTCGCGASGAGAPLLGLLLLLAARWRRERRS